MKKQKPRKTAKTSEANFESIDAKATSNELIRKGQRLVNRSQQLRTVGQVQKDNSTTQRKDA